MAKKVAKKTTKKTSTQQVKEEPKEDNKITLQEFFEIYKKPLMIAFAALLVITAMYIAYDVRSASVDLDGIEQRVEQQMMQNVERLIIEQIQQQYPNLDEQMLQQRAAREYNQVLETGMLELQGQQIDLNDLVQREAEQARQLFQSDEGQTYLTAIDPYFFYRESTNYYFNNHTGDTLKENDSGEMQPFTTLRTAPKGTEGTENPRFHVWLGATMFGLNNIDEQSTHGEKIAAIFTIVSLIAALAALPAYFIIRRFTTDIYAFIGSLLIVLQSTFVSRTTTGFFDTEAYGVVFPLIIAMLLVFAYFYSNPYVILSLGIAAGFFQGLGQWAWGQNWYILLFILLAFVGYLGYLTLLTLLNRHSLKEMIPYFKDPGIILGSYITSSILFTYIFTGSNLVVQTYTGFQSYFSRLVTGSDAASVWPNVLSSVAELASASFSDIMTSLGGNSAGIGQVILLIALMGIIFMLSDYKDADKNYKYALYGFSFVWFLLIIFGEFIDNLTANQLPLFIILLFLPIAIALLFALYGRHSSQKIFGAILLTVWLAGTLFMSFSGVRFIMLLAAPAGIAAAIGFYYLGKAITNFMSQELQVESQIGKKAPGLIIILVIAVALLLPIYSHAQNINLSNMPNFDDSWFDSMEYVREETDQDAIITSWWDFGHYFAAIGERGVTFDGASQDSPPAHWVGKLLIEEDPKVSQDIQRMLSCGWNGAHEQIMESKNSNNSADEVKAVDVLYDTFGLEKQEKREVLAAYEHHDFTDEDLDSIMEMLHCDEPPQTILITSGDMIGKAPVWAHWGLWEFDKKYVHDRYRSESVLEMAQALNRSEETVQGYVQELQNMDVRARADSISRDDLANQWFSPYPSYQGEAPCQRDNDLLQCQGGIEVNLTSGELELGQLQGQSIRAVVIPREDDVEVQTLDEDGQLDVVISPNYSSLELMQAPLGTSLFVNLYSLGGLGNDMYEEVYSVNTQTAQRVILWNVSWQ